MNKRIIFIIALLCAFAQATWAQQTPVDYILHGWDNGELTTTSQSVTDYTEISGNVSEPISLSSIWYVVRDNDVTRRLIIIPEGTTAHLIICDGAKLNCTIFLNGTLNIYGQSGNTGMINASPYKVNITGYSSKSYAPIGGTEEQLMGTLIIHGGIISAEVPTAEAENHLCAGIGGGTLYTSHFPHGGTVIVYGGTVTARGAKYCAGIGGSKLGNGGTLTVYGGTVRAYGGDYAAGIGGGQDGDGATVTVWGGDIFADGGLDAAGIGSGEETVLLVNHNGGKLTVHGGHVFADGTGWGAGIGGGEDADGAEVIIDGGIVEAYAGSDAGNKNGCAIGSEDGDGHRGTLNIGPSMMVHAGQNPTDANAHLFPSATRVPACFFRPYARIEPCNHEGATYTINGTDANGTHTLHCTHCLVSETHTHTFVNGVCTVCGVSGSVSTVSVYMPVYENNTYSYANTPTYTVQLVTGSSFELPTPETTYLPAGVRFVGWRIGSPSELGLTDPHVGENESGLHFAGESCTVNGNISLTPRFNTYDVFITAGNWNEPSNWCWNQLPTGDKEILIAAAATIPNGCIAQTGNNLTFDLEGTLTIADGGQLIHTNEGIVATVEKNIAAYSGNGGYYLLTNPVTDEQNPEAIGMLENNYDLYGFDQSQELEWRNLEQQSFNLENGIGYIYANDTVKELAFSGVLNPANTDISVPVIYDANADFAGLNLVGNPFVCNAYLLNENNEIIPFFKMNDAGNNLVAAQAGTAIKPCEGVFVICPNDGQAHSIVFTTTAPASTGEAQVVPSMLLPVHDLLVHQDASLINNIQTIALLQGWNWWSTNLNITLDDLKAALVAALPNATSITIKSQAQNISYNGSIWRGTLNALDVALMYEIQVPASCTITLTGTPLNPSEHPVNIIANGNTWIGFPLDESKSVDEAFGTFPVAGDIVKSKRGRATYTGTMWRGTLESLEPGQGYIYKSASGEVRTFTFPNIVR